jgi:hypothetical protein
MPNKMSGKELAEAVCSTLNSFDNRETVEEFVTTLCNQHRSLQQRTMVLVLDIISAYAKMFEEHQWDLRNEVAVTLCHDMKEAFGDRFHMPFI